MNRVFVCFTHTVGQGVGLAKAGYDSDTIFTVND